MDKESKENRLNAADWALIIFMVIAVAYAVFIRVTGGSVLAGIPDKYSSLPMMIYLIVGISIVACKNGEGPIKLKDYILMFAYPVVYIFLFSMT